MEGIPSEISRIGIDLWEELECETLDHGKIYDPEIENLISSSRRNGRCRLGEVGLTCGCCQNLYVIYQNNIPESRRKIELSFEAMSENCSLGNQSRDLSGFIQSIKFWNWK